MSPQELDKIAREAQLAVDAERAKAEVAHLIERDQKKAKAFQDFYMKPTPEDRKWAQWKGVEL